MRKASKLFVLLLTFACAHKRYTVPSTVEPFILEFQRVGFKNRQLIQVDDLIVKFDSLNLPVVGYCYPAFWNRSPEIVLDTIYWNSANVVEKELLVFHELGHCYLGRWHDDTILPDGTHKSLMAPTLIPINSYIYNKEYYQKELFNKQ